jgi:CRP-like cAMP-binding protein
MCDTAQTSYFELIKLVFLNVNMTPRSNLLLAELPEVEFERLAKHMELVSLSKGQTLFDVGQTPSHVYYPVGAIVSMMNDMAEGVSLETYMLGKACMVGVAALNEPSFYRATVRSSGLAYRMPVSVLQSERAHCPVYSSGALRVMRRMLMQMSQAIACSKRHSVRQQLVRWMLITLDRTMTQRIAITHQELAEILGFRREAITLAMGRFVDKGYIASSRGEIEVLDRNGLEAISCDCYWIGQEKKRSHRFTELIG